MLSAERKTVVNVECGMRNAVRKNVRSAECGMRNEQEEGIHCADCGRLTPNSELRTPNAKGFTLIEVIMTLVVLSVAAVGVLSVFTTGMKGSPDPLIVNTEIMLAQEKMAIIVGDRKNSARGFVWVVAGDYNTNPAKYPPEASVTGFAGYSRSVTIICVDPTNLNASTGAPPCAAGYARVTVTVSQAGTGFVSIDTLLTDY
jgi:prepilin-type N-terminal cleavage/methylation domain-containing protein